MDAAKEEFLRVFGRDYGYSGAPKTIDEIRATEFKRLEGVAYLDHAAATLYSELQMEAILKDLTANIYGNPHSQSDSSFATSDIVRNARQQVLDYFKASPKDYKCIFTSGATAALKLVGEAFPWSHQSSFVYTMENHNSVIGIREYALEQGAQAYAVDIEDTERDAFTGNIVSVQVTKHQMLRRNEAKFLAKNHTGSAYNLFAFPSECNFSGLKFSLELVKTVKEDSIRYSDGSPSSNGHWKVLIDAAKGCATEPPDLSKYPADFVVFSFYKLFGYPTGLGALIVHTDAAKLLKKTYFSGGTVAASIADIDFVKQREGIEELFEDGTIPFLSIASLCHGFKILNSLTIPAISRHTSSLATYLRNVLAALRHENGTRVCTLYGSCSSKTLCNKMGPLVSFNLRRPDGSWVGHREVEKLASLYSIQLRTGCFCNPGACAKYLDLSHLDLVTNIEAGHICWDDNDIINGKPSGAVRVSLGYMSTYEDVKQKFIDFVTSSFVSTPTHSRDLQFCGRSIPFTDTGFESRYSAFGVDLKSITVYPIKSCAGFSTDRWPLSSRGLLYDREWLLQSLTGETLTQKKVPEMCLIHTYIDLSQGILFINSPRCKEGLQIILNSNSSNGKREEISLRGQIYQVQGYDKEVDTWFSAAIGRPCTLLRHLSSSHCVSLDERDSVGTCRESRTCLNFSNEAQFLLISEESVSDLNNRLNSTDVGKDVRRTSVQVNPMRFRPNLVISGGRPYAEDEWINIKIGNKFFRSLGGCNRCQMINFSTDAEQVLKTNEPLATLASYRRVKGKILFGILLRYECEAEEGNSNNSWLRVGESITPDSKQLRDTHRIHTDMAACQVGKSSR
ncbi:molybdenum cofactor sulfurase isoform X2 [Cucurbita moschata]|uniref:Molybdenum cofactor sulfurase n=1 Tax=Cucurbita moschata TaxID=3662 RepID=A0A6J1G6Q6_CUCMO|nr:molybdenum cofactor sulfurase isoform X2 [Cucurbita moschata]